jgi:dipeptidyl-peptidase-4
MRILSKTISLLLFLVVSFGLMSQNDITLEEAVMGRWANLAPERLSNLSWVPGTSSYTFADQVGDTQVLVLVNSDNFEKQEIISSSELGATLNLKKPMTRIPQFTWISEKEAYFTYGGSVYGFKRANNVVKQLYSIPPGAENVVFRPNSSDMAFTRKNNLFAVISGNEVQITFNDDPNIVSGQTVSRVEFGIESGVIWSNSGDQLAFYEKDETNVTDYPLVDYSTRPASLHSIKYPMAGMASEKVRVGIYTVGKSNVVYVNAEGEPEQYLTSITWTPRDKSILVGHLNRDQNDFRLFEYSVKNGEQIHEHFFENDAEYVHPVNPGFFVNKTDFLWISERDGINQFYLYSLEEGFKFRLSTGDILVQSFVGYNKDANTAYFLGNHKDKIDRHLFEVFVEESPEWRQISKGEVYVSNCIQSPDNKKSIIQYSSSTIPNAYDLVEYESSSLSTLFTSKNPLSEFKIGECKMDTLLAADQKTILHSRMILPFDFDANKKYPVLVYVYNGPGVQLLHDSWLGAAPLWMYHFANKGYIVYTLDGRGSTNRGIEFEQSTFRNLGQVEMQDQIAGVDYLKSLSYVDTSKFAVHGWSYGGFMTTSLLTSYPSLFKVGVAGGPVMDWKYYEIMYTERYMDTPQTNKEGFELTSNILRAKNLQDKLLIIHGTSDPTVVKQHSDVFLQECIKNGIRVDYFEYPGHEHNVYGRDRVHLMDKVLNYIEVNL